MLVVLRNESFGADLDALSQDPVFRDCMAELGRCAYLGNHLIAGPPLLLEKLANIPELGGQARDGFLSASRWSVQQWAHARNTLPRLEIVAPSTKILDVDDIFTLPWTIFRDGNWLQAAMLAGENSNDSAYYVLVAQAWLSRTAPLSGVAIRLETCSFAGGNAKEIASNEHAQNRWLLAVADSDKHYPTAPEGGTAKQLKTVAKDWQMSPTPKAPFKVEVLHAHAVENLLPAELVKQIQQSPDWNGCNLEAMIHAGVFCNADGITESTRYLHLSKRNHCVRSLVDEAHPPHQKYLQDAHHTLKTARIALNLPDAPPELCQTACTNSKHPPIPCIWLYSVGKTLLPEVVAKAKELIKQQGAQAFAALLPFDKDPDWDRFCLWLGLWGLGRRQAYRSEGA